MSDILVANNSGGFWWVDIYLTKSPANCMFTSYGYNQFFMDLSANPPAISSMYSWMDVAAAFNDSGRCGISSEEYYIDPVLEYLYEQIMLMYTNHSYAGAFVETWFADDASWWEPVGVDAGYLEGIAAIETMWEGANNELITWTGVSINPPIYAGNNVAFDLVVTFETLESCIYSIREFISVFVNDDGLIEEFDVYYDDQTAQQARSACNM